MAEKKNREITELAEPGEQETVFRASVVKFLTGFGRRKNAMDALVQTYEKVQAGTGQVVGIIGETGVIKTRLMLEFKNRLDSDTYTYLQGQSIYYGDAINYLPILEIFKSYFEIEDDDQEFITSKKIKEKILGLDVNLEHTIPSFQELFSLKADDEAYSRLEPQVKKERTFEAIRDLLICESRKNVLILVIQDISWIDKASEDLLDFLSEWITKARIMIILL